MLYVLPHFRYFYVFLHTFFYHTFPFFYHFLTQLSLTVFPLFFTFILVSGEVPQDPVISLKTGHLFERRLIEKYLAVSGKCPVSGVDLGEPRQKLKKVSDKKV